MQKKHVLCLKYPRISIRLTIIDISVIKLNPNILSIQQICSYFQHNIILTTRQFTHLNQYILINVIINFSYLKIVCPVEKNYTLLDIHITLL